MGVMKKGKREEEEDKRIKKEKKSPLSFKSKAKLEVPTYKKVENT